MPKKKADGKVKKKKGFLFFFSYFSSPFSLRNITHGTLNFFSSLNVLSAVFFLFISSRLHK